MTKIFPDFSKERTLETGSGCCVVTHIDKDLTKFLPSKLEIKFYHFLVFAIRTREKFCLTYPKMEIISKIKKIQ